MTGIDCGEQVLGIQHNENGSALGNGHVPISKVLASTFFFNPVAALASGQIKVYNPSNGNQLFCLDNEEVG